MTAKFSLNPGMFQQPGSRYLRIDETVRNMVIAGKFHGRRPDQHPDAIFGMLCVNFVLRGTGVYTEAGGREHRLAPGTLFHRYPGVRHSTWFDPGSDYAECFVVFDGRTGDQLMKLGVISPEPVEYVGVDPLILSDLRELMIRARQPETMYPSRRAIIECCDFINRLYDRARSRRVLDFWDKIIEDACALLSHNFDEPLSGQDVAEELGVSYAALRKQFKRATGYSPTDYRNRRRLESAQYVLMTASVKNTASMHGYFDSFAFSRQFKSHLGISPSEFQSRGKKAFVLTPLTVMKNKKNERAGAKPGSRRSQ
jgi:AraC-like DNA-binding protein